MANPKLEQDWPAESTVIIDEHDIPDIPEDARPWNRPPAPAANAPLPAPAVNTRPAARRVPTPESHRAQAIGQMDAEAEAAALAIASFLAWARSIGYHIEVIEPIEAAGELVAKGQGLVDAFEARA